MANDTTNTTTNLDIEYPTNGYDATPTWAELYGAAFEDIDSALAERLVEEEVEDVVAALLAGGDKVGLTYDDANDQLTIDTTALDEEEVGDAVDALLAGGNAITTSYDDGNDQLTLAVDESAISHDGIDQSTVSSDDHHTRYSDSEASDAAPVQSVFGRVGQVAAQAGDYAASQITNFGSAVIGAIDGSDITPSSVDTPSVSTEEVNTVPTPTPSDGTSEIDSLITSEDTVIELRPGEYEGGQILVDKDNVTIRGAGEKSSARSDNGVGETVIRATAAESPIKVAQGVKGFTLENATIDGNKTTVASGPAIDLGFVSNHGKLKDVTIIDSETHAVRGDAIYNYWFDNVSIINPGVSGKTSHGFYIEQSDTSSVNSHLKWLGNNITDGDGNSQDFWHIEQVHTARIVNCEESRPGRDAIRVATGSKNDNVRNLSVIGCFIESIGESFLTAAGNVQTLNLTLIGNEAAGGSQDGIDLADAVNCVLESNRMRNFSGDSLITRSTVGSGQVTLLGNDFQTVSLSNEVADIDRVRRASFGATRIYDESGAIRAEFGGGSKSALKDQDGNNALVVGGGSSLDNQSFYIPAQDLSTLSLGSGQDSQIYRHDGSSSISADGGTTSAAGYYMWSNSASEFKSIVQH